MLNNLHVKNLALIDEVEVDFGEGLNILTGETGAGKSIIIGSLSLALGERADSDAIRRGAEYALVELSLTTDNETVWSALTDLGVTRESNELLIQRKIYPGRSVCRVNGETITLRELASVSELMIDICGQRESLKLLKSNALRAMLDDCGGEELALILTDISHTYGEYRELKNKLEDTDEDESLRKRKADLAAFELEEIDNANLEIGEDIRIEADYRRMQHSAKINEALGYVSQAIGFDNGGIANSISYALSRIRQVTEYDERIADMEKLLLDMEAMTADLNRDMNHFMDESEYDAEEFTETENRLNLINRLKDKYGNTIEKILEYRDEKQTEIEKLTDYEAYMEKLMKELTSCERRLSELCAKAHELRTVAARTLSTTLISALEDMNFLSCKLEVVVEAFEGEYTAGGYDNIDFLISLNPGEPLKPLSMVASGGELSRIMLAIKCVMADRDNIGTMVFDEIDTGISGVTAWKVAGKMSALSRNHQVICITHQAQIAAFADTHFLIDKTVLDEHTTTHIERLQNADMEGELARMMGADEPTTAALAAARDLKLRAQEDKLTL